MRRPFLIFLGAVLVPGLLLGFLAWRSIRHQEVLRGHERALLLQGATERLAQAISTRIDDHQREFSLRVESLLAKESAAALARAFDDRIRDHWPLASLGFAVSLSGDLLSPPILGRPEARHFLVRNNDFLCNRSSVQVFAVTPKGRINLSELNAFDAPAKTSDLAGPEGVHRFAQLIGDAQEGVLARFVDDILVVWVWYRTPREPDLVFGAQLGLASLQRNLSELIEATSPPMEGITMALLDDRSRAIAVAPPTSTPLPWDHPIVSAPVGPTLPNWRVAATVSDARQFHVELKRLRFTLGIVILLLVAAIAIGGALVATSARRQLELARRKTDFVSNVSHELKTPLTSIHLFAEMLAEDRVTDPVKRRHHLGIIQNEANRLNRLIANVLDFARHERGEHPVRMEPVNLVESAQLVAATFGPQFQVEGLQFHLDLPSSPVWVNADPDGVKQVLGNLVSNASKYAASGGEITVRVQPADGVAHLEVLDRGPGVPASFADRIFDEFVRADDALSSGIPGAGLGLTLARRIARMHGGDIQYSPRPGGGSCFRFSLPSRPPPESPTSPNA